MLESIESGSTYKDAYESVGISKSTFQRLRKNVTTFDALIKKAEQKCKKKAILTILGAAERSWQAAAWYLERRYKAEYARYESSDVKMSGNIPVTLVHFNTPKSVRVENTALKEKQHTTYSD